MLDGRLDPALCLLLTRQGAEPAPAAPLLLPLIRRLLGFRSGRRAA